MFLAALWMTTVEPFVDEATFWHNMKQEKFEEASYNLGNIADNEVSNKDDFIRMELLTIVWMARNEEYDTCRWEIDRIMKVFTKP